ncbi:MAG: CpaF family protein [Eubacteriales bacterium]|nr:CpaF family protein [Eubacteriales bacterium]MDD4323450.1 CpaF family protein [Eubacteriales bacterium]MDD4540695.1 CpaF family protein [Eubacteriales bacterium]
MGNSFSYLRNNSSDDKPAEEISVAEVSSWHEEISQKVLNEIIDQIQVSLDKENEEQRQIISKLVKDQLSINRVHNQRHLSQADRQTIHDLTMDEIFGYGPITKLLNDPTITEVMVNGKDKIYVEKEGKIYLTDIKFRDDAHVYHTIDKIVSPLGRRVDESSPLVDARLPDGSRVNVIIPPLSLIGPTITIRKFARDPYTVDDLISFGTLNLEIASFLKSCVRGQLNIIVSGGTGSGKTTLLNVLSAFVPSSERIITIEDSAELQLQQEHVVPLEARPANIEGKGQITIRQLVVNSLRMRPNRIIVGEVRSDETFDMLQAMNTGHDGSLTTIHANSPRDCLARMESLVHVSGVDLPSKAIREQIASAIDLVIQVERYVDGSRKVSKISEITGMEGDTIAMQDIYAFRQEGFDVKGNVIGKHAATGVTPKFLPKLKMYGETIPSSFFKNNGM